MVCGTTEVVPCYEARFRLRSTVQVTKRSAGYEVRYVLRRAVQMEFFRSLLELFAHVGGRQDIVVIGEPDVEGRQQKYAYDEVG